MYWKCVLLFYVIVKLDFFRSDYLRVHQELILVAVSATAAIEHEEEKYKDTTILVAVTVGTVIVGGGGRTKMEVEEEKESLGEGEIDTKLRGQEVCSKKMYESIHYTGITTIHFLKFQTSMPCNKPGLLEPEEDLMTSHLL